MGIIEEKLKLLPDGLSAMASTKTKKLTSFMGTHTQSKISSKKLVVNFPRNLSGMDLPQ